jgi:hypothetical protein
VHSTALQLSENLPDDANLNDRRMLTIYRTLCEIWCYCLDDKDGIAFWDVASCRLVEILRRFGDTHFTPEHAASYPRRQYCLWKPIFECKQTSRFECRRKAKYRCIRMQHCSEIVNSVFRAFFRGCTQCC